MQLKSGGKHPLSDEAQALVFPRSAGEGAGEGVVLSGKATNQDIRRFAVERSDGYLGLQLLR
jgi:hypothetical protein